MKSYIKLLLSLSVFTLFVSIICIKFVIDENPHVPVQIHNKYQIYLKKYCSKKDQQTCATSYLCRPSTVCNETSIDCGFDINDDDNTFICVGRKLDAKGEY